MEDATKTEAQDRAEEMLPDAHEKSITIEIDHLFDISGSTTAKTVYSTDTAAEALLNQIVYFDQERLLASPLVRGMIAAGEAEGAAVAYAYTVNEQQTNVIVDVALWAAFAVENGSSSVLGVIADFVKLAVDMRRQARADGAYQDLTVFVGG